MQVWEFERDGEVVRASVESKVFRSYDAMAVTDASPIVQLVLRAAAAIGAPVASAAMGGGCDANVLNHRGFEVANLGTGMQRIHTVHEWLRVSDMVAAAEVTSIAVRVRTGSTSNWPPPGKVTSSSSAAAISSIASLRLRAQSRIGSCRTRAAISGSAVVHQAAIRSPSLRPAQITASTA